MILPINDSVKISPTNPTTMTTDPAAYIVLAALLSALLTWTITYFGMRRRAWRIEIESWKAARRYYRHRAVTSNHDLINP